MNINRNLAPRAATALALAVTLTVGLSACSTGGAATPASTVAGSAVPTATNAPDATDGSAATPVAATTPAPGPTVTADAYSQVVAGKLYVGTELAPVRIGTDVPGQAPAAQAQLQRGTSEKLAVSANKYLVYVFPVSGKGWAWKVFGIDQWNNLMELGGNGYREGIYLPNRAAAVAGPFTVDGRTLDRAEFLLAAEN